MLENQGLIHAREQVSVMRTRKDWEFQALRRGHELFWKVYLKGRLHRSWARLLRRPYRLLELDQVVTGSLPGGSHYLGCEAVEIRRIRGSECRSADFDLYFRPLNIKCQHRWARIAMLRIIDEQLPPINLIQAGEIYFVRDGHHRISVARLFGNEYIDAEIIEIRKPIRFPTRSLEPV